MTGSRGLSLSSGYSIERYEPIRKSDVKQSEWDAAADYLLTQVEGLGDSEAGERIGIDKSTVYRWRVARGAGESIGVPRREPRKVLVRARREMRGDIDSREQTVQAHVEDHVSRLLPEMLRRSVRGADQRKVLIGLKIAVAQAEELTAEERNALDLWLNAQLDETEPER